MAASEYYHNGRPGYSRYDSSQSDYRQQYPYHADESSLPNSQSQSYKNLPYTQTSYEPSPFPKEPVRHNTDYSESDVPLRPYKQARSSQASIAPLTPHYDDPFVRDAKPGSRKQLPLSPDEERGFRGWFRGRITWCCFFFSLIQIGVFIAELARQGSLTGTPIQLKPSVNPMIGPSPYVLINMGARYQPCMHWMPNINSSISWPCPKTMSADGSDANCTLAQLCGFGGNNIPDTYGEPGKPEPNQWFRFIVPIFLHAGIIHIGFNLLLQLTLGRDMEKAIGTLRFTVVYISSGIFGFVLGGNFAANGIASTGASGSLFGILALNLLDLLYFWQMRPSPGKELAFIILDIVIAFALGLLPGLDNFSHIGGFLMGLVLGICLLRSPPGLSRRLGEPEPFYEPAYDARPLRTNATGLRGFAKNPLSFFTGRKPLWWAWWLVRAGALIGTIVGFIVLLKNFYVWHDTCSWCKYLSCINVNGWCDIGQLKFTTNNITKRDTSPLAMAGAVFLAARDI